MAFLVCRDVDPGGPLEIFYALLLLSLSFLGDDVDCSSLPFVDVLESFFKRLGRVFDSRNLEPRLHFPWVF